MAITGLGPQCSSRMRLPIDVACLGVGREDLTALMAAPLRKKRELSIAGFDGCRFGVLKHAPSLLAEPWQQRMAFLHEIIRTLWKS
jgi:hypothetical protein